MRIESSIMTSLSELRAIHTQRIDDERVQFEQARLAEVEARRAAESTRVAAAEAKLREERETQLRIEETRVVAEREARLRLEAVEAAEQARFAAELAAQRQLQELELHRAEVAKQRPRWMIVVTAAAICGAIGLGYFAIQRTADADAASARTQVALREQHDAKELAAIAEAHLAEMMTDLDGVHTKLEAAKLALARATDEAGRRAAQKAIDDANRAAAEKQAKLEAWQRKHDHDIRVQGLHQDGCANTVLGCLK